MKILFTLILVSLASAKTFGFTSSELKAGDVLLISLNCYECRIIESETNSPFSHSGVVLVDENRRVKIAQSLGKVAHVSFEDFSRNKTPGTAISVYRPKDFKFFNETQTLNIEKNMLDFFNEHFKGAPFDSRYEWNNFNSEGRELLYCSEFIAKFLDFFLKEKTILVPLTYQKHYEYWLKYFRGNVPKGIMGNSPSSFMKDSRFFFVGNL